MGGGRSLNPDESRQLQAGIKLLIARHGTQTAVAELLGVTQQALSTILAGVSRGSYAMARTVARALNRPVESFLSGQADGTPAAWRDLPGWADTIAQARALFPRTSSAAWEWLGSLSGPPLPGLPPLALALMATAYDQADATNAPAVQHTGAEGSGMRRKITR